MTSRSFTLAGSFLLSVFFVCVCVRKCHGALPLVVQIHLIEIQKNVLKASIDCQIGKKGQAAPNSSECTSYYGKTFENVYVCNDYFTGDCFNTMSVTDTNCWVPRQERGIVEAYYRGA